MYCSLLFQCLQGKKPILSEVQSISTKDQWLILREWLHGGGQGVILSFARKTALVVHGHKFHE